MVALAPAAWHFLTSTHDPTQARTRPIDGPGNMRRQGVRSLIAYCLKDACRQSSYPGDTLVPWFRSKVKCAMCGARANRVDCQASWKDASRVTDWCGHEAGK